MNQEFRIIKMILFDYANKYFILNHLSFLGQPLCNLTLKPHIYIYLEMFYLNTIKQLFLFVEQLDHLVVCLPYSRLLTGITILAVFQKVEFK